MSYPCRLASPTAATLLVFAVLCAFAGIAHGRPFIPDYNFKILEPKAGDEYVAGDIINVVVEYEKPSIFKDRPQIDSAMVLRSGSRKSWTLFALPEDEWKWDDESRPEDELLWDDDGLPPDYDNKDGTVTIPVQLPEDLQDCWGCVLEFEVPGSRVDYRECRTAKFDVISRGRNIKG